MHLIERSRHLVVLKEGYGTPGLYVAVSLLRMTFFVKRFSASPANSPANFLTIF
jgi:hypothetical protein